MDFIPYGQAYQPHQHVDDNYAAPIDLSPYRARPGNGSYGGSQRRSPSYGDAYDNYDRPPSGGYNSSHTPYVDEYQNYTPPPPPSYVGNAEEGPYYHDNIKPHNMPGYIESQYNNHRPNNNIKNNYANNVVKPMPAFIEGQYNHRPNNNSTNNYANNVVKPIEQGLGFLANKRSNRIYCKAGGERFAVGIRDEKVILTRPNPNDPSQHWYKDERHSTKVKDEERQPSFILVNKATGQAIKHSVAGQPVQLIPYKPADAIDVSILWTESKDLGYGFRTIRNVNNISLVMDAFHGDKDHGGVHDGTFIALYKCWKGDNQNQQWKIVPY